MTQNTAKWVGSQIISNKIRHFHITLATAKEVEQSRSNEFAHEYNENTELQLCSEIGTV